MKIVVTCGPSFEPIDEVRRITNFSTGQLGLILARALEEAGHEVICFRGVASTYSAELTGITHFPFSTNKSLADLLHHFSTAEQPSVIFHTAALSDFQVSRVLNTQGEELQTKKIPSRQAGLLLELRPAPKIIHQLRTWFPLSRIVGWKYELDGPPTEVLARAQRQVEESRSDACVLNGQGFGPGFGFYQPSRPLTNLATKEALCQYLVEWCSRTSFEPN